MYIRKCLVFFQAEDGIRDLVRSRGLGDVYKRQTLTWLMPGRLISAGSSTVAMFTPGWLRMFRQVYLSLIHI